MVLEAAAGVFAPWLWQKIADAAKSHDDSAAIEKALKDAIQNGFERFAHKHKELTASLLDQHFLVNHAGPELAKYLTRNKTPDVSVIAAAYRTQIGLSCPADIEEAIADLLNFIMEAMKDQTALQSFIDRRKIEETCLAAKETGADVKQVIAFLDLQSQSYTEDQTKQRKFQTDSLQAHSESNEKLSAIQALLEKTLAPQSSGHELNKLLAKQLDMARDKIRSGLFKEAREILDAHSDEVAMSDDFTKFRWHTRLFTELAKLRDGYSQTASKWFGRFKRRCGILEETRVFHSFRHGFASLLGNRLTPLPVTLQLMGHERGKSESEQRYMKDLPASVVFPHLAALDFGIDLDHLKDKWRELPGCASLQNRKSAQSKVAVTPPESC